MGTMLFRMDQPVELVREIVYNLPEELFQSDNTTFLDPAMGKGDYLVGIAQRLKEYGHSKENILSRLYGFECNAMYVQNCLHRTPLAGANITIKTYEEVLEWTPDMGMKFDVVIGNPPYQESAENNNHPLWPQFCTKANALVDDGGIVAFVTPQSWIGKQSNKSNDYSLFETNKIKHVTVYDQKSSPFAASTTISWWIMEKRPTDHITSLVQVLSGVANDPLLLDIQSGSGMPMIITPVSLSIHNKILTGPRMHFEKLYEFHNEKLKKKALTSDMCSSAFPYKNHVSHRIVRYTSVKFSRHDAWKVMVPVTGTLKNVVIDNMCGHGEDMCTLYVESEQEAKSVAAVLQLKLYQYIGATYRQGRNLVSVFRQEMFPAVDFTRSWTDAELYAHFNLTQEEIDLIESTVK